MEQKNEDLQSLIDQGENNIYKSSMSKFSIYGPKTKNLDFYQSLLCSTNSPGMLFSELNQFDEVQQSSQDIMLLQYDCKQKRKRGRPKKQQKVQKKQQEYSGNEQQEFEGMETLNKRKKKKQKRVVKGDTKNIFHFFLRIIISYLEKKSNTEKKYQLAKLKPNRYELFQILKDRQNYQILKEMFDTRFLNRQVVLSSRLSVNNKILYLKKIQIFQQIFNNKDLYFQKPPLEN